MNPVLIPAQNNRIDWGCGFVQQKIQIQKTVLEDFAMIDTILSDSFPKEVTKAKVKEIFEILHTQERPDLIKEIKNLLQLKTNGKDGLKTSKVSKIII